MSGCPLDWLPADVHLRIITHTPWFYHLWLAAAYPPFAKIINDPAFREVHHYSDASDTAVIKYHLHISGAEYGSIEITPTIVFAASADEYSSRGRKRKGKGAGLTTATGRRLNSLNSLRIPFRIHKFFTELSEGLEMPSYGSSSEPTAILEEIGGGCVSTPGVTAADPTNIRIYREGVEYILPNVMRWPNGNLPSYIKGVEFLKPVPIDEVRYNYGFGESKKPYLWTTYAMDRLCWPPVTSLSMTFTITSPAGTEVRTVKTTYDFPQDAVGSLEMKVWHVHHAIHTALRDPQSGVGEAVAKFYPAWQPEYSYAGDTEPL